MTLEIVTTDVTKVDTPVSKSPLMHGRKSADEPRKALSKIKASAAKCIQELAEGGTVAPEKLLEVSMLDVASIAFGFHAKGVPAAPYKDRLAAHQLFQERLAGKPTQKTESETMNRFVFEGPDWWFNRADTIDADDTPDQAA